jgi:hypothetical protein
MQTAQVMESLLRSLLCCSAALLLDCLSAAHLLGKTVPV